MSNSNEIIQNVPIIRGALGGDGGEGTAPVEEDNTLFSTATASVLDLVSEGEIEGLVNGAKSIFFDGTPLKDTQGNWNYRDVSWQEEKGTQSNRVIPGFETTATQVSVNQMVEQDGATPLGVIRTITSANMDAIRVSMYTPSFVYVDNETGDQRSTTVRYTIELKPNIYEDWIPYPGVDEYYQKEGKITTRYDWNHKFPIPLEWKADVDFNSVQVRVKRLTADSTNDDKEKYEEDVAEYEARLDEWIEAAGFLGTVVQPTAPNPDDYNKESTSIQNKIYWGSYSSIIENKFSYPNSAIMGIRLDARQFGHVPVRGYEIRGVKVRVPSNYNPYDPEADNTVLYNGIWDGSFDIKWTMNPAWIYYDLLTNPRYGLGEFLTELHIDKWSLYTIGRYCDAVNEEGRFVGLPSGFVDNEGVDVMEPRFTCNLYLQGANEAYKVLQDIASVFRGLVYWDQGLVSAIQDRPKSPVFQFSESNVIGGNFSYTGSSKKARHTVVLVTWNDPEDGYKQAIEYVEDRDGVIRYGVVEKSIVAFGCTSRGQARRAGRWLLYTERMETEGISFQTGLEGAPIRPGDLVKVSDKHRAGVRYGGRLLQETCSDTGYYTEESCSNDSTFRGTGLDDFSKSGTYTGKVGTEIEFVVSFTKYAPYEPTIHISESGWNDDYDYIIEDLYLMDGDILTFINKGVSPVRVQDSKGLFDSGDLPLLQGDVFVFRIPPDFSKQVLEAYNTPEEIQYSIDNPFDNSLNSPIVRNIYDLAFPVLTLDCDPIDFDPDEVNIYIDGKLDTATGTGIPMTGRVTLYNQGITYQFTNSIGHEVGDSWVWKSREWNSSSRTELVLDGPVDLKVGDEAMVSLVQPGSRCINEDGDVITGDLATSYSACTGYGYTWEDTSFVVDRSIIIDTDLSTMEHPILHLDVALDFDPAPLQIWSIERPGALESQLFRVLAISEKSKSVYNITGLQYNGSKFDAIELGDELERRPISNRSEWSDTVPMVGDIVATEELHLKVDNVINRLHASWGHPISSYYCLGDDSISEESNCTGYSSYATEFTCSDPIYFDETSCTEALGTWAETPVELVWSRNSYNYVSHYEVQFRREEEDWVSLPTSLSNSITIENTSASPLKEYICSNTQYTDRESCIENDALWEKRPSLCYVDDTAVCFAGTTYSIRVRTIAIIGNRSSAWNEKKIHLLGKTSPPADVLGLSTDWDKNKGLSLTWSSVRDLDLSHYEVRKGTNWDTAEVLKVNVPTPYLEVGSILTGTHTFLVKAVDTSGNYSYVEDRVEYSPLAPASVRDLSFTVHEGFTTLTWSEPTTQQQGVKGYEVRQGTDWANGQSPLSIPSKEVTYPVTWGPEGYTDASSPSTGSSTFWVAAIDYSDNFGSPTSITIDIGRLSTPELTNTIEGTNARLSWIPPITSGMPVSSYQLRQGDSWESSTLITNSNTTEWSMPVTWGNNNPKTLWVAAVDSAGNVGYPAISTIAVINPSAPVVAHSFNSENVLIQWSDSGIGSLPILEYEIRYGVTWEDGRNLSGIASTDENFSPELKDGTTKAVRCSWGTKYGEPTRAFWVQSTDTAGNKGIPGKTEVTIVDPAAPVLVTSDVIDNYIILDWDAAVVVQDTEVSVVSAGGQLPIQNYRMYSCGKDNTTCSVEDVADTSLLLGPSTFITKFESAGGVYKYFLAAVDSAGNEGEPMEHEAIINQPANFVLHDSFISSLDTSSPYNTEHCDGAVASDAVSCTAIGGTWVETDRISTVDLYKGDSFPAYGPVDTTETWAEHIVQHPSSWGSEDPYVTPKPGTNTFAFTHVIDLGVELTSSNIQTDIAAKYLNSSAEVDYNLNTYWTNNLAYFNEADLASEYGWEKADSLRTAAATNLRYVKVICTFNNVPTGDLVRIDNVKVSFTMSEQVEEGSGEVTNAVDGQLLYVDGSSPDMGTVSKFIDVKDIEANYSGLSNTKTAIVDFVDQASPVSATVYVYDIESGTKTTGSFTWRVLGVKD